MIEEISFDVVLKSVNDWAKIELERRNLTFDDKLSLFMQLQNYFSKIIPSKPRKVSCSQHFNISQDYHNDYEKLKLKIIKGDDINSFLSRKLNKSFSVDGLLDHYGCHHFHFKESGTGLIALAVVTEDEIFFIDCKLHGWAYPQTWTDTNVLEILDQERPDLMRCIKYPYQNNDPKLTPQNIMDLRNNGYNFFVNLDSGDTYGSTNYGSLWHANKYKRLSVKHFDRLNFLVREIQYAVNLFISKKNERYDFKIENLEILDLESEDYKVFDKFKLKLTYTMGDSKGEVIQVFQKNN